VFECMHYGYRVDLQKATHLFLSFSVPHLT
jgi:hypothetical protein